MTRDRLPRHLRWDVGMNADLPDVLGLPNKPVDVVLVNVACVRGPTQKRVLARQTQRITSYTKKEEPCMKKGH